MHPTPVRYNSARSASRRRASFVAAPVAKKPTPEMGLVDTPATATKSVSHAA
ncbi:hypothetical protein MHO82_20550 [Vibrio sp. Of7-15]|uniref:hypothetical protein n=1 Tax=Vibrio sp. Of7-15 TaxID=2724879 RepID=UPI001EF22E3A|nr:hypothetical protein [Vibrio sp. Of7-15]MCG7499260.1 hypothetical protein [Vibrio sp. Of7-15]